MVKQIPNKINDDKVKPKNHKKIIWIIIGLFLLINIPLLVYWFNQSGLYDQWTIKLVCKNQVYDAQEAYQEQVPYTVCTHNSFWTGACDVWATNYNTVTKYRTVNKYIDVCLKIREWETPDYNTNWLNELEKYDKNGNPLD